MSIFDFRYAVKVCIKHEAVNNAIFLFITIPAILYIKCCIDIIMLLIYLLFIYLLSIVNHSIKS